MDRRAFGWYLLLLMSLSLTVSCVESDELEQVTASELREDSNSRALYVNGFAAILGNRAAEKKLLEFVASREIKVLLLYELHLLLNKSNADDLVQNSDLANFVSTAKADYGVKHVAAIGEQSSFFRDVIQPFNNSRTRAEEKFDIYNLEFEFWIDSRVEEVYAEPYLVPNGLDSNIDGAFQFFLTNLKEMRTLALESSHPVTTEAYIGWTDKLNGKTEGEVSKLITQNLDRLRVHAYRSEPDFEYTRERLARLANAKPGLAVSIIFSGEEEFMQAWLRSNSMEAAEAEYRNQLEEVATDEIKSNINLLGFTYFSYSHTIDVPVR